jgi:hypothetical protein
MTPDHELLVRALGWFIDWMFLITPPAALAALAWRIAR